MDINYVIQNNQKKYFKVVQVQFLQSEFTK